MTDRLHPVASVVIKNLEKCKYQFRVRCEDRIVDTSPLILEGICPNLLIPIVFTIGGSKVVNALLAKKNLRLGDGLAVALQRINNKIIPAAELKLQVRATAKRLARRWSRFPPKLSPEELGTKLWVPLQLHWRGHSIKLGRFPLTNIFTEKMIDLILEPYRDLQDPPSPVRKMAAKKHA